jgi:O-antigen/teichoic acid export membrane protein
VTEARTLARSGLLQQVAQGSGIVVLFVIVTVLARHVSLPELGAYGLLAPLAGYLLVLRNIVAGSAVKAMVEAGADAERGRVFSAAAALYLAAGVGTALLILAVGCALAVAVLDGDLQTQAVRGALGLAAVTAVGIAVSVHLDALRASRLLARAATLEIVALALFLALMLALILGDADLWLIIAANGSIPLFSGLLCLVAVRRLRLPYRFRAADATRDRMHSLLPTAGYLLVIESATALIYGLIRPIVGLYKSAATVGLVEGPIRAHNLFYAFYGALGVTALPTVSGYSVRGERARLRELVLRGSRYTLALVVPVCVALICLSDLVLEVWLGDGFDEGGTAMAVMLSYWLLFGSLGVHQMVLVGLDRAREVARYMAAVAASVLVLSLALTPALGLEGPAVAVAASYIAAFPFVQRLVLRETGTELGELARTAWLPAYSLGAVLAGALVALRNAVELDSTGAVIAALAGGIAAYWLAWWLLVPDRAERATLRGFLRSS